MIIETVLCLTNFHVRFYKSRKSTLLSSYLCLWNCLIISVLFCWFGDQHLWHIKFRNRYLVFGWSSSLKVITTFSFCLSSRFHPENVQEFLSIKKTKSEGWKCDVSNTSVLLVFSYRYYVLWLEYFSENMVCVLWNLSKLL